MSYSVFALYASGKDAVMGGMLVVGVGYIIWGWIAPRFAVPGAAASAIPAAAAQPTRGPAPTAPARA
jgi:putrescine:ornithine antiporter